MKLTDVQARLEESGVECSEQVDLENALLEHWLEHGPKLLAAMDALIACILRPKSGGCVAALTGASAATTAAQEVDV